MAHLEVYESLVQSKMTTDDIQTIVTAIINDAATLSANNILQILNGDKINCSSTFLQHYGDLFSIPFTDLELKKLVATKIFEKINQNSERPYNFVLNEVV